MFKELVNQLVHLIVLNQADLLCLHCKTDF